MTHRPTLTASGSVALALPQHHRKAICPLPARGASLNKSQFVFDISKVTCIFRKVTFDSSKPTPAPPPVPPAATHALMRLPTEDLDLIVQLVLASGSLKDLAAEYGVSYPTIRLRLDKVIERLQSVLKGRPRDPVNNMLAALLERGEISPSGARALRDLIRSQQTSGEHP